MAKWHDSFDRMKQRPHILVCCPQAVGSAWGRVLAGIVSGRFTAWQHQLDFASWFAGRSYGLLAADMGTGKTFAALMGLLDLAARGSTLVHVDLCRGTTAQRAARLKAALDTAGGRTLVVTVNYEAVWRSELASLVESVRWSALVLDESHRIKSPGGKASRWLAKLAKAQPRARRLCLTGTPMPHSPLDLYGQARFLDPDIFGTSFTRMRARYAECDPRFPSKVRKWRNQDELAAKLD